MPEKWQSQKDFFFSIFFMERHSDYPLTLKVKNIGI